jgi:hypothetical protein
MNETPEWRQLAEFGGGVDADVAEAVLRAHGIPVIRRGPEVGIFGPGFTGPTAHGVSLLVPADRLAEAQAALEPPPA